MAAKGWREKKRIGIAALLFVLFLILLDRVRAQADTLADVCDLDTATSVTVYNWQTGVETTLTGDVSLQALGAWQGEPTWVSSGGYGYFGEPTDLAWYLSITATLANGETRVLYVESSVSQPESVWLYAFDDLGASADADGNHYGVHHLCAYWKLSADVVSAWVV